MFCLLLAVGAATSSPVAQNSEKTPVESGLTERVDVQLFQVNFLATDKKGRPVTDLEIDEIEVIDQRKPQRVAFLEPYYRPTGAVAVDTESPPELPAESTSVGGTRHLPAPTPERWIMLVFDNYASRQGTRVQAVEAALRYVDEQLQHDDLISVVSFNGELNVLQGFTNDRYELEGALQETLAQADRAISDRYGELEYLMSAMETCKDNTTPYRCARKLSGGFEFERRREADTLTSALIHLLRSVAPIPEAKTMVLFSNGVARSSTADAVDAARVVLGEAEADRMIFGQDFKLERWRDKLVSAASEAKTSIFTINPGGNRSNHLISASRRAPLDEAVNRFQIDVFRRSDENYQATLGEFARRTGGVASQSPDVHKALTRVIESTAGMYTVGYYPAELNRFSGHDIKIRIRRKGVKAIWPREVPRRRQRSTLLGELTVEPGACSEQDRRLVKVTLRLDLSSLTFESVEKQLVNNFSIYLRFVDPERGKTLYHDYRFFNITHDPQEATGDRVDPQIEELVTVPCLPMIVKAAAVDTVSGARLELDRPIPR